MAGKRVTECLICGKSGCMEFEDKFYCFRFGKTYKKTQGIRHNNGSLKRGGKTFQSFSANKQCQFKFEDTSHIDAISL